MIKGASNQSLVDAVLQAKGSVEPVFEAALLNGMSITDSAEYKNLRDFGGTYNQQVVKAYNAQGIQPASDITEGIGGERIGFSIVE